MSVKPCTSEERSEFDEDERPKCQTVRRGDIILLKGRPCEVVDVSFTRAGKHGFGKIWITGVDVFTLEKHVDIFKASTREQDSSKIDYPVLTHQDYTLIDAQLDGFLTLMSDDETLREDLKLPKGELGKTIKKEFGTGRELLCTVMKVIGEEGVIAWKDNSCPDS